MLCDPDASVPETYSSEGAEAIGTSYYIAATEEIWDYNRRGVNILGESTDIEGVDGYLYSHHEAGKFIGKST